MRFAFPPYALHFDRTVDRQVWVVICYLLRPETYQLPQNLLYMIHMKFFEKLPRDSRDKTNRRQPKCLFLLLCWLLLPVGHR